MADWEDGYWWSADGLRLHYRDYPGTGLPIICIPGLTRNARDFAEVADRLKGRHRLILVELRGRGESAYAKDPMSYVPLTYLQDVQLLIDELKLDRLIMFGTSLGGLILSLLATSNVGRLAGALINDVGPVIDPAGLARIRSYVGKSVSYPTWLHAARGIAETQASNFPGNGLHDWLAMAKRLCRLTPAGRIVFDYDMAIAEPFRAPGGAEPGVDMWPVLNALKDIPTLLVRGGLSDLLKPETAARMLETLPQMEEVVIARVGHTPSLSEPPSIAGIDRLLARIAAAG
ncbi:alpha/beta fold hydrolase [Sphingomonas montanisoli]|uniref:Alpha/beta hydrolase n=1 Tax=Sphingomonas montanisoli TaxID=2606412 RepID=A0A5D9BZK1_9SPHN|nr:alpha/beta hydrolase [Sphingomonas montanisoli]TZG25028.1 alpha/beta hydrolase [Sphingomonas montanisoli]